MNYRPGRVVFNYLKSHETNCASWKFLRRHKSLWTFISLSDRFFVFVLNICINNTSIVCKATYSYTISMDENKKLFSLQIRLF